MCLRTLYHLYLVAIAAILGLFRPNPTDMHESVPARVTAG